jgi:uncharacterized SAM-binding protein YcdF (DUF218 family)
MKKRLQKTITLIFVLLTAWAGGFIFYTLSTLTSYPHQPEQTTDAIVVLTGGSERVEQGLGLFAAGKARHLFISGVHEDVRKNEITALWHGETALPPCCITLGHEATTTAQNAQEVRKWLAEQKYNSIRLVTSDYHMNRALLELKHALPGVEILPHPIVQSDINKGTRHYWEILFGEYHKALLRTIILAIQPKSPMPEHPA